MAGRVKRRIVSTPIVVHCTDTHCSDGCFHLYYKECGAFGSQQGGQFRRRLDHDDKRGGYLRCPECIEAEKRGAK